MKSAFAHPASPEAGRSRWIPWVFVAGMLTVVAVNGVLVFFATQSWGGLVTNRAFERGIAYNRLIAAAAAEEALGWKAAVAVQSGPGAAPEVIVTLRNADEQPMTRAIVAVEARRPLEAQDPIILAMRYVGDGRYAGAAEALRAGQWDMRLTVANEGSAAHFTRRIYVQ